MQSISLRTSRQLLGTSTCNGENSRDPLSLPLETPFGSPSTIVTPFLLTRPVSAASGAGQGGDDADAQQDGSATTFYDNAPTSYANTSYAPDPSSYAGPDPSTYAPDPSSYAPPISLLTTTTPQVYTSPEGYRSPPQAPDYRKMQTDPTSIPLSGYLQRFKDFFQKLSNLPWVATDRVTVDYYPGMRKDGEWGRRERRWTVSWTRKGEGESSETERKSGKLAEIDLSSSSGSTPASPIQRGPNGIQYPPQQFQYPLPFWVTNAQQQQPQLYYSYGNPTLGNPIYPYAGGEGRAFAMVYPVQPVQLDQVLGQPVRVQMGPQQPIPPQAVQSQPVQQMQQQDQGLQPSQYPAGYAPDHRADRTVWGSPVHRVQVVSQGSAGVGMGDERSASASASVLTSCSART
ncbi:hypothetical protein BDQ17DRAFT_392092 [Cyathus striatus]|nr:hypothetical protein BDQ17DRAFT_392092 [Cyathus striatus]